MIARWAAGVAAVKLLFVSLTPLLCLLAYMALLDLQQQPVAALWELLPGVFRRDFGEAGATYPGDEVIAFLVDTNSELNFLMSKYCSADDLSSAISVFQCLLSKAHLSAAGRIKRRVLVDPAWQRPSVAHLAESVARSPPVHTLVWFRDMSGTQLRRRCSAARRGRADGLALEGESRAKREHSELLHWREELAQLIKEAGLPVVKQALLSFAPEAVIIAAVGCPRASTIRKRVREWRKIRAYSMSVCGSPWPDHVDCSMGCRCCCSEIFVSRPPARGVLVQRPLLDACMSAGFEPTRLKRWRVRCACSALLATCVCSYCSSLRVTRLGSLKP